MLYILLPAIIIFCLIVLYILSTCCRKSHRGLSTLSGWSYAHRGLHGNGVPENSLQAFQLAREAGYGSELDVHLLADGNLAIMHDSLLKRTTGADGRIEELTVSQLASYRLEGTSEKIPLLSEVLALYDGKAPLIVELKPVGNNTPILCQKVCELLEQYKGIYCVESFDPRCTYWFRKHRPDIIRGQLTEDFFKSPSSTLPGIVKFIMKHQITNFLTFPDFIAYRYSDRKTISNLLCRKLWGAAGVSWTLVSKDEYDTAVSEGWIPIFEGFRP